MSQWLSCLPSLGEAECSLILQSKSLALEGTQMGRASTIQSLAGVASTIQSKSMAGRASTIQSKSLAGRALAPTRHSKSLAPEVRQSGRAPRKPNEGLRKIQDQASRVSRAFTELCR